MLWLPYLLQLQINGDWVPFFLCLHDVGTITVFWKIIAARQNISYSLTVGDFLKRLNGDCQACLWSHFCHDCNNSSHQTVTLSFKFYRHWYFELTHPRSSILIELQSFPIHFIVDKVLQPSPLAMRIIPNAWLSLSDNSNPQVTCSKGLRHIVCIGLRSHHLYIHAGVLVTYLQQAIIASPRCTIVSLLWIKIVEIFSAPLLVCWP